MEYGELEIPISSLENIKGKASESFIISKLIEEGYKVRKLVRRGIKLKGGKITSPFIYLNKLGIEDILKEYKGDKERLEQIFRENLKGLPDLVCIKHGAISFIEVKNNNSFLTEEQEKVISLLKLEGFGVDIKRVKIDISISEIK